MDKRLLYIADQLVKLSQQLNEINVELDSKSIFDLALAHIADREGFKLTAYIDTLGIPTVGVGHVIRPEDNLKVGDTITPERVRTFLQRDGRAAFEAAYSQLVELGLDDSDFLIALTSVNFQLGVMWRKKFPKTWALIKAKQYTEAAKEAANSIWAKQSPVRVKDFQDALIKLRSN